MIVLNYLQDYIIWIMAKDITISSKYKIKKFQIQYSNNFVKDDKQVDLINNSV